MLGINLPLAGLWVSGGWGRAAGIGKGSGGLGAQAIYQQIYAYFGVLKLYGDRGSPADSQFWVEGN